MKEQRNRDDLKILESVKTKLYEAFKKGEALPKVGELLKVIEMKKKLSVEGKGEKQFWEMINRIRTDELKGVKKRKAGRRNKKECSSKSPQS